MLTQPAITISKLTIETLEQRCETCSKLTIKPPKRRHWRRFGGFIVNFEHISNLCPSVCIVNFEQVNAVWDSDQTHNLLICDELHDLVTFAQFKKPGKHPLVIVNFSKVAG